jgi:hypothetical protein
MGRTNLDLLVRPCVDPAVTNATARKHERVRTVSIDDG